MKGGFRMQVYLQETCRDAYERSGTNKLIWECCISYSTLIGVVFGVPLNHRRVVSTAEMDVDFVMIGISSIFASNC